MRMLESLFRTVALLALLLPTGQALAAGPHEGLDCLGCHDPHYAKAQKLSKVANEVVPNPRTGKPIEGVSAATTCQNTVAPASGRSICT